MKSLSKSIKSIINKNKGLHHTKSISHGDLKELTCVILSMANTIEELQNNKDNNFDEDKNPHIKIR